MQSILYTFLSQGAYFYISLLTTLLPHGTDSLGEVIFKLVILALFFLFLFGLFTLVRGNDDDSTLGLVHGILLVVLSVVLLYLSKEHESYLVCLAERYLCVSASV